MTSGKLQHSFHLCWSSVSQWNGRGIRQKAKPTVDKITVEGESMVPAESLIPNALTNRAMCYVPINIFGIMIARSQQLLPSNSLIDITQI